MFGYLIRRILLMVPTVIGILLINFAILRWQSPTFAQVSAQAESGEGDAGSMSTEQRAVATEQVLIRFRRTGRDLPAVVNLRGFAGKEDAVEWLEECALNGPGDLKPSDRNVLEKDLWLQGRFFVMPLAAVLQDQELAHLHGPASMALSLCAYKALLAGDLDSYTPAQRNEINDRNDAFAELRINYRNSVEKGFETLDAPEEAERKRAGMVALVDKHKGIYDPGSGEVWGAIFVETGFVDLMGKLFTGQLYSESKKENVFTLIGQRWQVTFWLQIVSVILAWCVSIPLGIRSARRRGSLEDRATTAGLYALWALPSFFVGTLLLLHFCTNSSYGWQIFPNQGLASGDAHWYTGLGVIGDLLWHWFLPLIVLSYSSFTALSRYMRGSMLDNLQADYVRTARAKGANENRVVYGHVLRNSMVTMITLGSGLLTELFAGFLFVEMIFSIQGLGRLLVEAALVNDVPLVMGATIISVLLLLISILLADILYAVADPRIRSRYG